MGEWKQNPITIPPEKIFEVCDRLRRNSRVNPETGCWEWQRGKSPQGYGLTTCGKIRGTAHRISYAAFVAPLPANTIVRHKVCDNPPCINPAHLETGSQLDNVQDQKINGTWTSPLKRRQKFIEGIQVCQKRNHPLVDPNIRYLADNKIACKECHRMTAKISGKKRRDRLKALRVSLADSQQAQAKEE